MSDLFSKAKREKSKARICLTGTSGSGKTVSALYLAYGLTGDWGKIAVIDSERNRSLFYANRSDLGIGEFLQADLEPPYSVEKYIDYMTEAEKLVGSDGVVIIDSGTHAWKGTGGVLEFKEQVAGQRGKTDFSAWSDAGKVQNKFIDKIMDLDCHVIVTLRSKAEYAQEKDPETGKTSVKKIGLAPEQRNDFEYEFVLVLDLDKATHTCTIIKDNTFLDAEGFNGVITPELGQRLKEWLAEGKEPEVIRCEKCSKVIKSAEGKNGRLSPKQVAENAVDMFGKKMCMDCCIEEINKQMEEDE